MNVVEFLQQSAGKWSSVRTSHHWAVKQQEGGKSDVKIEMLDKSDPAVIKLCQQHKIDPQLALCGARITWEGTIELNAKKQVGSTVLVPLADPEKTNEGQLLREVGPAEKAPTSGRYIMGSDDALTLITEYETMSSKERLWFESPNVRLRHSILQQADGFRMASFCSEVRMGGAKPQAQVADAATKGSA